MYRLKKFEVMASEIADYLNRTLEGDDFAIVSPDLVQTGRMCGRMQTAYDRKTLVITDKPVPRSACGGYILSDNPDLDLAYILREFFASAPINQIHPTAVISPDAQVGRNVMVGSHSCIGPDVRIGDNTRILNNVVVNGPAVLGRWCVIKDGAVIGSEGWGFIDSEEGIPFHPPQLGLIRIEDRVWIGSNATIERGMVEETVICSDVKIDDLVHIGAGCRVGQRAKITAGVVVATNVSIGNEVHIAPNAVIREDVQIADGAVVGMGAVVLDDLSAGGKYVGNPAKLLKNKKK